MLYILLFLVIMAVLYPMVFLHKNMMRDISSSTQPIIQHETVESLGPRAVPRVVTNCTCVDCDEDKLCGGLWRGNRYPGMPSDEEVIHTKMHIVVSYCKKSLDWMPTYLEGFTNIASIHVISKCGQEVKGAPDNAVTVVLPNVGRCDHAYAHYITDILPQLVTSQDTTQDNSITVFLKDTTMVPIHQSNITNFHRNDLKSLAQIASSMNGFVCGLGLAEGSEMSAYHDVKTLLQQKLSGYNKGEQDYKNGETVPFLSKYKTLGDFYKALNFSPSPYSLVQECYGGIFAVRTKNILQQDMAMWRTLRKTLVSFTKSKLYSRQMLCSGTLTFGFPPCLFHNAGARRQYSRGPLCRAELGSFTCCTIASVSDRSLETTFYRCAYESFQYPRSFD